MRDSRAELERGLEGRYRLERELGRGGMAVVHLARDVKHDRPVALKVLHDDLAAALGPGRFQREIRFAARLQHPHILTVLDSGAAAGHLWFTMPFVDGETLRARLERERQLPLDDALRITREAAQALHYAHQQGIVHRDVKPENILLTRDGNTLVADFGIARALAGGEANGRTAGRHPALTGTGTSLGTPAYMSPEQASGDPALDGRSDVYSLASVLYEMLAGEPPFTGASAQQIIVKRFTDPVPSVRRVRPSVPEAIDRALQAAMAPTAAGRFGSAAELAAALRRGPPDSAAATPATEQLPIRPSGRRRPLVFLALGFLLGLGVLFAWRLQWLRQ